MLKENKKNRNGFCLFFISLLTLLVPLTQAQEFIVSTAQPAIGIIIDDMGNQFWLGHRAVNLAGNFTYSFLPHAPHVAALSKAAHELNKEIMLHLPMQAESGRKLGPGGLTQAMSEESFIHVLDGNINSIPHVAGFNNHMGSLLTKSQLWMKRLMREVAARNNLFFVDSKTTSESVALKVARAEGLRSIPRDVFIDHKMTEDFIYGQLENLISTAKKKGTALAIAHPKKLTLSILEKWLPELKAKGVQLVSVSKLITLQQQQKKSLLKLSKVSPQL